MDSGDSIKELLTLGCRSSIAKAIIKAVIVEGYTQTTIGKNPAILTRVNHIDVLEELSAMRSIDPRLKSEYQKISRVREIKSGFLKFGLEKQTTV